MTALAGAIKALLAEQTIAVRCSDAGRNETRVVAVRLMVRIGRRSRLDGRVRK